MWNRKALMQWTNSARRFGYRLPDFFPAENGKIVGAELGVYKGQHAELMLSRHPDLFLYCVDMWELWLERKVTYPGEAKSVTKLDMEDHKKVKEVYEQAKERIKKFPNRFEFIKDDTISATKKIKDGSLDFVYVDGDHTYDGCYNDLKAWWPKLKEDGLMAGHDYGRKADDFGVPRAIKQFAKEHDLTAIPNGVVGRQSGCWIYVKGGHTDV